jgi:hypothetical protein
MFRDKFEGKSTKMGKEGINGLLGSNPAALTKNRIDAGDNREQSKY